MTPIIRKDVLKRLNYIGGHLQGVKRMVSDEQYCIDVINQIKAISEALRKVSLVILKNHLETCVPAAIKGKDKKKKDKKIREILNIFNDYK